MARRKSAPKVSTLKRATSQGTPSVSRLGAQPPVLMGLVSTATLPPGGGPAMSSNPNPVVRGLRPKKGVASRSQRILMPSTYASSSRRARGKPSR